MDFLGGSAGYVILKALHILAAMTWVGGALAVNILGARLRKARDPVVMARVAEQIAWLGTRVFMTASLAVLGLGIWMVATSAWNFGDLWIEIGILGIVATIVTGAGFLGPTVRKIGELIDERGAEDTEVEALMTRLFTIQRIDLVVLAIVVLDMVAKPVR